MGSLVSFIRFDRLNEVTNGIFHCGMNFKCGFDGSRVCGSVGSDNFHGSVGVTSRGGDRGTLRGTIS